MRDPGAAETGRRKRVASRPHHARTYGSHMQIPPPLIPKSPLLVDAPDVYTLCAIVSSPPVSSAVSAHSTISRRQRSRPSDSRLLRLSELCTPTRSFRPSSSPSSFPCSRPRSSSSSVHPPHSPKTPATASAASTSPGPSTSQGPSAALGGTSTSTILPAKTTTMTTSSSVLDGTVTRMITATAGRTAVADT
ncbi:hypothetical protein C8R46DRAFT_1117608 [Mycena filopes]|nr:hypothetical protein C8R46DRAFT_1117608 [Mycena filopes]